MPTFLFYFLPAIIGAAAVGVSVYWNQIRENVANWLHRHGLENSILMEACVQADRLVSGIRAKVLDQTWDHEVRVVIEEVDDPDVLL